MILWVDAQRTVIRHYNFVTRRDVYQMQYIVACYTQTEPPRLMWPLWVDKVALGAGDPA